MPSNLLRSSVRLAKEASFKLDGHREPSCLSSGEWRDILPLRSSVCQGPTPGLNGADEEVGPAKVLTIRRVRAVRCRGRRVP